MDMCTTTHAGSKVFSNSHRYLQLMRAGFADCIVHCQLEPRLHIYAWLTAEGNTQALT